LSQLKMHAFLTAWSQFADHVKVVSRSDLFLGETKESYKSMCSEDHQKTLSGDSV